MYEKPAHDLHLHCENLEERQLLSSVDVFAAGVSNQESIELQIDGVTVQTWNNLGGDAYGGQFVQLTFDSAESIEPGQIRVVFTNDLYDPENNVDNNVRIDKIIVDGETIETESPDVFSTGTWKPEDGVVAGFREDEFLHVNGYFQFPSTSQQGSEIQIRARGDEGTEQFQLRLKDQVVETFSASVDFELFRYSHDEIVLPGEVRIEFINDEWNPDANLDANLIVDYAQIDDVIYQTEDPSVFSTGSWKPEDGITPGFRESETLNSNGYFQFAETNPVTESTLQIRVRGNEGSEAFRLLIDDVIVATFEATTEYQRLTYQHNELISAEQIKIEFFNDEFDEALGIDANLIVDFISIDGVIYQTESPTVYSTGTWRPEDGIVPGFRESETLHTNGIFQFAEPTNSPGRFRFELNEVRVDESSNSVQVRVDRVGGSEGVVNVDYATSDLSTTELEDYVPVVGKLTFGDGETSMLVTIPIVQDPFVEGDETFQITLSNPTQGSSIESESITVTIADDDTEDPAGLFRFERPMYMIMEEMPFVTVTIVRTGGTNGEVSVDYFTDDDGAIAGEDYATQSGTLIFADGETEKTVTIPILDDAVAEDDERFWMYLENPTNGAAVVVSGAQLIIRDNEPRPGSGDGLYAEYFDESDFTSLKRVRTDSTIDFDFGAGAPADLEPDTYSIRWTGQIESLFSEQYTFYTTSDDGVRLWIDGQLLIDNWTLHAATVDTATFSMEAGKKYDIRMEYFENEGNSIARLEWSSVSQSREIIPRSQLYAAGTVELNGRLYRLTPTAVSWSEGQAYAQQLGGNLVTLNSAEEEAFLQDAFGTGEVFWMGLNDLETEGEFVWVSGEEVTYTNFARGEPNNNNGAQNYGTMNFGTNRQWDDDYEQSRHFGLIEVTGDSLPTQNSVFGRWSEVIQMPNIAVAAAQLPDGEILTWSSWDRFDFRGNNPQTYTSVFNTSTRKVEEFLITETQHDMFCPGTVMLPDGRILVNGGGSTVTSTSVYDFRTDTWTRIENMNLRRWYNTSTTLADGRVLTWGGSAISDHTGNMEIYEDGVGWTEIQNSDIAVYKGSGDQTSWHPQMFQAPNGKVFIAGPGENMYWADVDATGEVLDFAGVRGTDTYSQHGSYVMYDVGKILKFGGADREANNGVVTDKAYIIDITGETPVVTETGSLNIKRKFLNGLVLPDGRVMAIGGNTSGAKFSDFGTVYSAEVWDPATGEWSVMDSMDIPRNYHSIALLQADGTVFAAGGGLTGGGPADHPDAQVFSPDYLFNEDGSLADRPDIQTVDQATYGEQINVQVTDGQEITKFHLVRMSTVTHSVNTDQRLIPLEFTANGVGEYLLDLPASGNIAPPGFYMLYALNADGVPSEAAVMQLS